MKCESCSHLHTQVKDSRSASDGHGIRRRRFCPNCKTRFFTIEMGEDLQEKLQDFLLRYEIAKDDLTRLFGEMSK